MKGRSRFRFRYRGIMSALGGIIDTTSKYLLDLFANDFEVANEVSTFNQTIGHSASTNATMTSGYGPNIIEGQTWTISDPAWTDNGDGSFTGVAASGFTLGVPILEANKIYQVEFEVYDYVSGTLDVRVGNSSPAGVNATSNGTYTALQQQSGNVTFYIFPATPFTGSVRNISVREMPTIKWRPHNLLTYSEDFSVNSSWIPQAGQTETTGQTDYEGGSTATLVERSTDSFLLYTQNKTLSAADEYTFGVVAKYVSGTGDHILIRFTNFDSNASLYVDLTDGSKKGSYSTETEWNATVTPLGNGFYLIEGAYSSTTDLSGAINIYFTSTNGTAITTGGATSVLLSHTRLYRSDLGGMVDNPDRGDSYVPTTSSAVYLPRRGHHIYNGYEWVNEGMLHESEARTNLVTHSVLDTNWNLSVCTITENDAIAPDGTLTATKLTEGNTDAVHAINANISLPAGDYAISFYGKSIASNKYLIVGGFGLSAAGESPIFDLQNGLVYEPSNNTIYKSAEIEDVGNGWYRGTVRVVSTSTSDLYFQIVQYTAAFGGQQYVGTGTDCFHLWGIQTENTDGQPSSYIPTSGATVTRAAESLTIPAANLPWPTPEVIGSELVTNGTFDTDVSGWVATACSITNNSGVMRITDSDGGIGYVSQTVTLEVGKAYEMSVDVVTDGITGSMILNMGTSGGSGQMASTSLASGTGTISAVFVATQTTGYLNLRNASALAGEFWEVDNISVKEINPLAVSIQMDGRMTWADLNISVDQTMFQWVSGSDFMRSYMDTGGALTGRVVFQSRANGVDDFSASGVDDYSPGVFVPFNIASRHGSTFINGAVDGVALTANTTPTALPDLSTSDLDLGYDFMGTIQNFQIWDRDIGDQGLVDETAPSLEPSLFLTFDGTTGSYSVRDWSE